MLTFSGIVTINSPIKPIKALGAEESPSGAISLERGHFYIPVTFYRMKIAQFLARYGQKHPETHKTWGQEGALL